MYVLAAAAVAALINLPASAQTSGASLPLCHANDLSLSVDDEGGNFNGMSHSGTLVVLRNIGPAPCRVPPFPEITFADAHGTALPIKSSVSGSRGMHPGPVVFPAVIVPAAELTAQLRWVSGEVFTASVCLTSASLAVTISGEQLHAPLTATLCGERTSGVSFERSRFVSDPVYQPRSATAAQTKP